MQQGDKWLRTFSCKTSDECSRIKAKALINKCHVKLS